MISEYYKHQDLQNFMGEDCFSVQELPHIINMVCSKSCQRRSLSGSWLALAEKSLESLSLLFFAAH